MESKMFLITKPDFIDQGYYVIEKIEFSEAVSSMLPEINAGNLYTIEGDNPSFIIAGVIAELYDFKMSKPASGDVIIYHRYDDKQFFRVFYATNPLILKILQPNE